MHPLLAEIIGPDLLVIVAIVALLFGGSQIPKFARSLGSAKREFELGLNDSAAGDTGKAARDLGEAGSDQVTMTRGELDAFLAEKEEAARRKSQS